MDKATTNLWFALRVVIGGVLSTSAVAQPISLDEVARKHGLSAEKLQKLLEKDKSAKVTQQGRIQFTEAAPEIQRSAIGDSLLGNNPTAGSIPSSETFLLHSRPGAQAKIFLNFQGTKVSNTQWNTKYGVQTIDATPYSIDSDPAFSEQEKLEIRATWLSIADDYAPFNIDVTTEIPSQMPSSKYIEVVFTNNADWFNEGPAGGVAYLYDFSWNTSARHVCFVFAQNLAGSARYMAEAGAHEAGHTFGLYHWGTSTSSYYAGDNSQNWAPIMGVGYYTKVTTWSRGEYTGALSGSGGAQDDFAQIQSQIGTSLADDADRSLASAKLVSSSSGQVNQLGVLNSAGDVDVYRIDAGFGDLAFQVKPSSFNGDADFRVRVLNANGTVLFDQDPSFVASVSSTLYNVSAGTYYVEVTSVGYGSPFSLGGYSVYGSMGRYQLLATHAPAGSAPPPPSPTPWPTATPQPTPESTPTPTPWPTATPWPTPESTPTPEPTPQPSPTPVNPDSSLSVSIQEPISRTVIKNGVQFQVVATAFTEVGLSSVQFKANGVTACSAYPGGSKGTLTYSCNYRARKNSANTIVFEAVVTNLNGKVVRSAPVSVTVR